MRYAAGLDGGGSKTALCCLDKEGNCLFEKRFGSLNINGAEVSKIRQTIRDVIKALDEFGHGLDDCAGLVIATAGISNPTAHQTIQTALSLAGFSGNFMLQGDQEAALRGAVGQTGAILIAGTGSICFGKSAAGISHRAGGWGYLVDDEGSGYALGRDMLKAVFRAYDGRSEKTALTEAILSHFGEDSISSLVRIVYEPMNSKTNIAGLTSLLQPAVDRGDMQAAMIALRAGDELMKLCSAVIDKLQLQRSSLALCGGVLENIPAAAHALKQTLHHAYPDLKIIKAKQSAAWGAADLAREAYL